MKRGCWTLVAVVVPNKAMAKTQAQKRRHKNAGTKTQAQKRWHKNAGTKTQAQKRRHKNAGTNTHVYLAVEARLLDVVIVVVAELGVVAAAICERPWFEINCLMQDTCLEQNFVVLTTCAEVHVRMCAHML